MSSFKYSFIFLLFLSSALGSQASLVVTDIICEGNKRTKESTIFRESRIQIGDTLQAKELDQLIVQNENQLLSTGLFNSIVTKIDTISSEEIIVNYAITENWYLYPSPLFELADRNFNVWWQEQGRDLRRTIYGMDLSHFNLTGRRDPFKIRAHAGYTRKIEFNYTFPIIWKNWGLAGNIFYADNKEIGYKTIGNKTIFGMHPDEEVMRIRRRTGLRLLNRPNVYTHHSFRIEYHHNSVNKLVAETLNPNYFLGGKTAIRFMYFEYDFQFDKRDYNTYPREGYFFGFNFKKEGLYIFNDFDNTSASISFEYYKTLPKQWIVGWQTRLKANLDRSPVSYANNTGLGWGGYRATGFDLYVLDGTDFIIFKNSIKRTFFKRKFKLFAFLPDQFETFPIELNIRFNVDFAYVNERTFFETNLLNNRWIIGYGPSLDLILYNNFFFSFEYGINDLGDRGLYLHTSTAF